MTIGFFLPLPLPLMLAFMMWQSAAIGSGFGSYYQFSKRKISAMSNDEFNKLTFEDLTAEQYRNFNHLTTNMGQSFRDMDKVNAMVLEGMKDFFIQTGKFVIEAFSEVGSQLMKGFGTGSINTGLSDKATSTEIENRNRYMGAQNVPSIIGGLSLFNQGAPATSQSIPQFDVNNPTYAANTPPPTVNKLSNAEVYKIEHLSEFDIYQMRQTMLAAPGNSFPRELWNVIDKQVKKFEDRRTALKKQLIKQTPVPIAHHTTQTNPAQRKQENELDKIRNAYNSIIYAINTNRYATSGGLRAATATSKKLLNQEKALHTKYYRMWQQTYNTNWKKH